VPLTIRPRPESTVQIHTAGPEPYIQGRTFSTMDSSANLSSPRPYMIRCRGGPHPFACHLTLRSRSDRPTLLGPVMQNGNYASYKPRRISMSATLLPLMTKARAGTTLNHSNHRQETWAGPREASGLRRATRGTTGPSEARPIVARIYIYSVSVPRGACCNRS
jgi:hypothetical protein